MSILINCLLVFEALVALLMMFVILMQRPKSEGLGAAFGGGVTENIFGAQTTTVLTNITTWLASIFFVVILALSVLYAHRGASRSGLRQELMKTSGNQNVPVPMAPGKKAVAPLPPKAAAQEAAADAKAHLDPVGNGPAPVGAASPPSPADAAVGVVPAAAGPVASPSAAPSATP